MRGKKIQKNKKILFIRREIIVIFFTIILTTLIVRGFDNVSSFLPAMISKRIKDNSPCSADMVFIPKENGGFCIDKYENSASLQCPFQNPKSQEETRENLNNPNCKPISVPNALPWTFISRDQAEQACAKAGKRLPTNEEWYLASLGTPDKSSNWAADDCHLANNWDSQPGRTGSGKNCVSSFGVYDMIGNVWEWVKGAAIDGIFEQRELPERGYVQSTDGKGMPALTDSEKPNPDYNEDFFWIQKEGPRAIARGGYWDNKERAGMYSVYIMYLPSQVGPGTGFRCAK